MTSLYWHDYETWGVDPSVDRPCQFAGVRTDENLNLIGDPLVIYCQPPDDVLPHPEACLVTGIAPQVAQQEGLLESEFIKCIHQELAAPGTCGVGYNSLRFDDEVTRYTLYRNFYDPYEREWRNGNGRWDLIDTVRLCYALRPEGMEWPIIDGRPSFRLEHLTAANGISHQGAHDAYSDVAATIDLARLVRRVQPALYQHVYTHKHKSKVIDVAAVHQRKPLLHVSAKFSAEHGCLGLVMPLAMHPTNKNAIIVYDLAQDPADLIRLDAEAIAARVFTAQSDLPEGQSRIPLKLVHLNKCPILLTPKLLDSARAQRLNINLEACQKHWQALMQQDLASKVQTAMSLGGFAPRQDPERQLYDGFISDQDKALAAQVRAANGAILGTANFVFTDARLQEMLLRYKARNFPESLSEVERHQWHEFCRQRLQDGELGVQSIAQVRARIQELDTERALDKAEKIVLRQLYQHTLDLERRYRLGPKCRW